MNQDLLNQQSQVLYVLREGLWKTCQGLCQKLFAKTNDPFFQFWKAFCLYKTVGVNEAFNELTLIKNKKEFQFATSAAMQFYQSKQRGLDKETLEMCRQMQNDGRKTPNDRAFASTIYFYLFVDEDKKAKEVTLLLSAEQTNNLIVRGWYELLQKEDPVDQNKILEYFQGVGAKLNNKSLDYLLGLAKAAEQAKKYIITLDAINEISIVYKDFVYADFEKIRINMLINDWDQYQDLVSKILYNEPSNILALKAQAFYVLARKGEIKEASDVVDQLLLACTQQEEENINLLLNVCQLVSRISGRNAQIIQLTIGALTRARKQNPLQADLCLEIALETLMLEDYDKAYDLFKEAAALDEGRMESLSGMIQCKIEQGVIDESERQLEFLIEVQQSNGKTPEIAFLQALLENKKTQGTDSQSSLQYLDEALKLHIQESRLVLPGFDFFIKLNPDMLYTMAQLYLRNLSMNTMLAGKENPTSMIGKGTKLLDSIIKQVPGMANATLLLATGKMALGDPQEALKAINKVLQQDPRNEDAYILQALISIKTGQTNMAQNSLNQAISNNFTIRENPLFMLVKGEVEYRSEDYKSAQATLEIVYEYVAGKQKGRVKMSKSKILQFSEKDRCQVFVLLAKSYAKNKKEKEARQIMQKAIVEYTGSPQEGLVMMANSEVSIESGDIKKAINILKAVTSDKPIFQTSRIILADVYLKYIKDRRNYTKCYHELLEAAPTFENYKLLGDALMRINEPHDAVIYYEKAFELNSADKDIVRVIGNALSLTYDYQRAIKYYEDALAKLPESNELIVDLADLCIRINNTQKAEKLLVWETFLPNDYANPDLKVLKANSKAFTLIAKLILKQQQIINNQAQKIDNQKEQQKLLAEGQKLTEKIRKAYELSIVIQKDAVEKAKAESGNVDEEKSQLGKLLFEQAKYYFNIEKNFQLALDCLDQSSKYNPTSENIIQLQAECLYQSNDLIGCEQKLKILSKINPKNDYASMMLSELLLRQDDSERQIQQFLQLLQDKPNSYGTLSKIIEWYRKQNRLEESLKIIENSQKGSQNPNEPGLCFCRGLYYKYKIQPKEALIQFNFAKKNHQYAEESLTHMIDLYLNPDLDLPYSINDEQAKQVNAENLKACDQLLRELQNRGTQQRYTIMQSYVLQASNNQKSIELASTLLTQTLKQNQNSIPAMLALAINKFLMKKQTEGKNLLKMLYTKEKASSGWESEELEKAWLLHAESFIAIQKYDQAEEVIRKILKQNKSCGKAEEFIGLIKEKEQSYQDASNSYEKAFKLSNQKNPTMGYRLAFNYFKAKRNVECINVCKQILEINPNYPKLQQEILSKAILALRQ